MSTRSRAGALGSCGQMATTGRSALRSTPASTESATAPRCREIRSETPLRPAGTAASSSPGRDSSSPRGASSGATAQPAAKCCPTAKRSDGKAATSGGHEAGSGKRDGNPSSSGPRLRSCARRRSGGLPNRGPPTAQSSKEALPPRRPRSCRRRGRTAGVLGSPMTCKWRRAGRRWPARPDFARPCGTAQGTFLNARPREASLPGR